MLFRVISYYISVIMTRVGRRQNAKLNARVRGDDTQEEETFILPGFFYQFQGYVYVVICAPSSGPFNY